ncbi:MAG TPA: MerR family transcriptional regulator [Acetobacteraceae bacterium]
MNTKASTMTASPKPKAAAHDSPRRNELVSIRDMTQQSGVPASTLRYYEKLGLIASEREGSGDHRRYRELVLQRINYIALAQRAGFSLEEIAGHLARLPANQLPCGKDWKPLSRLWEQRIDQRIAELEQLKIDLRDCATNATNAAN